MLVGFCTESSKGPCQDTPPLLHTTIFKKTHLPNNHKWRKSLAFFKKHVHQLYRGDPWVIDSRKRWAYRQPTGEPDVDHPWIFKKACPHSHGIRGATNIVSTHHVRATRPRLDSPHSKSYPSQSSSWTRHSWLFRIWPFKNGCSVTCTGT
jgi:hypothetical protein